MAWILALDLFFLQVKYSRALLLCSALIMVTTYFLSQRFHCSPLHCQNLYTLEITKPRPGLIKWWFYQWNCCVNTWQSVGHCKMQSADYCFHHVNENETTIVTLFSNAKNSSLQSAFYTALTVNVKPTIKWLDNSEQNCCLI